MQVAEMEPAARERLLEALLDDLVQSGFATIDVAGALDASDVSRADFEAEFDDLESALTAAYRSSSDRLIATVEARCSETTGNWSARVAAGLEALLAQLSEDPGRGLVLIRKYPAINSRTRAEYERFLWDLAALLEAGRRAAVPAVLPDDVEMFAVGSAESIVADEIDGGRTADLRALAPEILFSILVPFLGPTVSAREMEAARNRQ